VVRLKNVGRIHLRRRTVVGRTKFGLVSVGDTGCFPDWSVGQRIGKRRPQVVGKVGNDEVDLCQGGLKTVFSFVVDATTK
jgi:hypothetical protein